MFSFIFHQQKVFDIMQFPPEFALTLWFTNMAIYMCYKYILQNEGPRATSYTVQTFLFYSKIKNVSIEIW